MPSSELSSANKALNPTAVPVRVYLFYRLFLALVLLALGFKYGGSSPLNIVDPALYRATALVYLVITAVMAIGLVPLQHIKDQQALTIAVSDILALTLLIHASGGISGTLVILMVVAVAAANIVISGRKGTFISALATLAMFYEQLHFSLMGSYQLGDFTQTATIGMAFFAIGMLTQHMAARAETSRQVAEQKTREVSELETLNQSIIERLRTGIMVLDEHSHILLGNQAAYSLLDVEGTLTQQPLAWISEELNQQFKAWQSNPALKRPAIEGNGHTSINANFSPLNYANQKAFLVFLEDNYRLAQEAQAMKLASLGKFTASIAHEIRNPLAAVSHSAQLLKESEKLDPTDARLCDIIHQQSQRMNEIIETILQLSRRDQGKRELIQLEPFLQKFISHFSGQHQPLQLNVASEGLRVRVDPGQLAQILTNLAENAIRYSPDYVAINAYQLDNELPVIEVIDRGPGIDEQAQRRLFEPFYTTENEGTGLGLYISHELCEANHAHINYQPAADGGSCFQITFAHPERIGS